MQARHSERLYMGVEKMPQGRVAKNSEITIVEEFTDVGLQKRRVGEGS